MNVWAVDSLRVASIFPAMSRITDAFPTSPDPKRLRHHARYMFP